MNHSPQYGKSAKPKFSEARSDKIRKLIAELETRDVPRDDIGELLNLSPPGVRKYIKDLAESGVIDFAGYVDARPGYVGQPVYRLTFDSEHLRKYVAGLAWNVPKMPRVVKVIAPDPTRHVRKAAEMGRVVARNQTAVPADPWMLPRAFFGEVRP